ncbi:S41 family peptidase [bacterium]|nr:S41 family peptidase [bacterium]
MKLDDRKLLKLLLGVLIVVVVFTSYVLGQVSVAKGSDSMWDFMFRPRAESKLDLVGRTLAIIMTQYQTPIEDDSQLIYGAIEGMMNTLHKPPWDDPYSGFLGPETWHSLKATTEGSYAGVGILIGYDLYRPFPAIVTVFPDGPADTEGVHEKDLIIEVDGVSTQDMLLDEVAALIRGEVGTEVTITVTRENVPEPVPFVLERALVDVHTVTEHRVLEDGAGYIRIATFGETTPAEVEEVVAGFADSGVERLIIDLRNNGGGLLLGAVGVANLFIKDGLIVSVESRNAPPKRHMADPESKKYDFAIAVLTSPHTASASEVLAGALRDHGLATLVGEQTFGKGVVQEVSPLDDDNVALALTIGRYLTPLGHDLGGTGLEPDIVLSYEDYKERDPKLARLEAKVQGKQEELLAVTDELMQHLQANDYQLKAAQESLLERPGNQSDIVT